MEELPAANIFTTWNVQAMKLCIDHLLDRADLVCLPAVTDGDTDARFTSSCSPAATVRIHFDVVRQFVVDYMRDAVNVDAACSNICGAEQLDAFVAEAAHYFVALLLCKVTM